MNITMMRLISRSHCVCVQVDELMSDVHCTCVVKEFSTTEQNIVATQCVDD